jgi:hypothetical protein
MVFFRGQANRLLLQRPKAVALAAVLLGGSYAALGQTQAVPETPPSPQFTSLPALNGVSLGTTFEHDIHRILALNRDQPQQPRPLHYAFVKYAESYLQTSLSPETVSSNFAAAASGASLRTMFSDFSAAGFQRRLAENLTRKGIAGAIDFTVASLLEQDVRFLPSNEHGLHNRLKYAFLQTFVVRGREGDEIAVSRIAASFGTAWALNAWNPWMKRNEPPGIFSQTGIIFGRYMVRSFWSEFRPDIKHEVRLFLKRDNTLIAP